MELDVDKVIDNLISEVKQNPSDYELKLALAEWLIAYYNDEKGFAMTTFLNAIKNVPASREDIKTYCLIQIYENYRSIPKVDKGTNEFPFSKTEIIEKILETNTDNNSLQAFYYGELGAEYLEKGNIDKFNEFTNKALSLDDNCVTAYQTFSRYYFTIKNYDNAIYNARKCVALLKNEKTYLPYNDFKQGEYIDKYLKKNKINTRFSEFFKLNWSQVYRLAIQFYHLECIAEYYGFKKEHTKSAEAYQEMLDEGLAKKEMFDIYDFSPDLLNNYGHKLERVKQIDKAIEKYKQAIELNQERKHKIYPIKNLARIYERKKEINKAISIWEILGKDKTAIKEIERLRNLSNSKKETPSKQKIEEEKKELEETDVTVSKLVFDTKTENKIITEYKKEFKLEDDIADEIEQKIFLNGEYEIYKHKDGRYGKQFQAPEIAGRIDLLLIHNETKDLLVIELKRNKGSRDVFGQTAEYIGYVRKYIANQNQKVKGLIILSQPDEKLKTALFGNGDIEMKLYKKTPIELSDY